MLCTFWKPAAALCLSISLLSERATAAPDTLFPEQRRLTALGGAVEDGFGFSVALGGGQVFVGAPSAGTNGQLYRFNAATGAAAASLVPTFAAGATSVDFGAAVCADMTLAAVGATGKRTTAAAGNTYLFHPSTGAAAGQFYPFYAPGNNFLDEFGAALATDGAMVVVGAPGDDEKGTNSGAAYLYRRVDGAGLRRLVPNTGIASGNFGRSVAVSGDYVLVGCPGDGTASVRPGAVYVFRISTLSEIFRWTASDALHGAQFGHSLAVDGDLALIGCPLDDGAPAAADDTFNSGSAYIFRLSTGLQERKLTPPVITGLSSRNGLRAGTSVALKDGLAFLGAPRARVNNNVDLPGAVYVHDLGTSSWLGRLAATDRATGSAFGGALAIGDGRIAVGAASHTLPGIREAGAVYLFDLAALRPSAPFEITFISRNPFPPYDIALQFNSQAGQLYRVQRSVSLASGSWSVIGSDIIGTGPEQSVFLPGAGGGSHGFLRIIRP